MPIHISALLIILRTYQCMSNGSRLDYLRGNERIPDPRTPLLPMAASASPAQESKGTRLPIAIQPNAKPNNTTSMHISEERLTFEKEVLETDLFLREMWKNVGARIKNSLTA